ncbi:MAG: hypothetical protein DRJ32_00660 [Thermoprotei archaeon]|nr:MAG: hypothetical protein DRJ32_00660 [Thermoprotei archaeon]HDD64001.1 hypothetical protein [Thermoprotei archaeon]
MNKSITVTILLLVFTLSMLKPTLVYPQPQALAYVDKGKVVLENDVIKVYFKPDEGAKIVRWIVKTLANVTPITESRYPYEWIPTGTWPGEIFSANFTYQIVKESGDEAVVEFKVNLATDAPGLEFTKIVTIKAGEHYWINITYILDNKGTAALKIQNPPAWGRKAGFMIEIGAKIGRNDTNDIQIWKFVGQDPIITKESWVVYPLDKTPTDTEWIGLFDNSTDANMVDNATYGLFIGLKLLDPSEGCFIWLEAAAGWTSIRTELKPLTLEPGQAKIYKTIWYCGPIWKEYLEEAGFNGVFEAIKPSNLPEEPPGEKKVEEKPKEIIPPTALPLQLTWSNIVWIVVGILAAVGFIFLKIKARKARSTS